MAARVKVIDDAVAESVSDLRDAIFATTSCVVVIGGYLPSFISCTGTSAECIVAPGGLCAIGVNGFDQLTGLIVLIVGCVSFLICFRESLVAKVVGVGDGRAVRECGFGQAVGEIVSKLRTPPCSIDLRGAIVVRIVLVSCYLPQRIGDRQRITKSVVGVAGNASTRISRRQWTAQLVVSLAGRASELIGAREQVAERVIGVTHCTAVGVGPGYWIALVVYGVGRDCAQAIAERLRREAFVIRNSADITQLIRVSKQTAELVVGRSGNPAQKIGAGGLITVGIVGVGRGLVQRILLSQL